MSRATLGRWTTPIVGLVALLFLNPFSNLPLHSAHLPLNEQSLKAYLRSSTLSPMKAHDFLRNSDEKMCRVLNVASPALLQYSLDLPLVGDWFGKFKWFDFFQPIDGLPLLRLKEWSYFGSRAKTLCISHVVIDWNNFSTRRPLSEDEWGTAIPLSTRKCIQSLYFDGQSTEVFKLRDQCLN
jgi:hypothetical protein